MIHFTGLRKSYYMKWCTKVEAIRLKIIKDGHVLQSGGTERSLLQCTHQNMLTVVTQTVNGSIFFCLFIGLPHIILILNTLFWSRYINLYLTKKTAGCYGSSSVIIGSKKGTKELLSTKLRYPMKPLEINLMETRTYTRRLMEKELMLGVLRAPEKRQSD